VNSAPDVAVTYLNEKSLPYVQPLAAELESPLFLPLDVSVPGQLERYSRRSSASGAARHPRALDRVAPKDDLQGGLLNCSAEGSCEGDRRVVPFVHPHGEAGPRR